MIKTAPHSTLSPQMWCIKKKNKTLACTHPDLLARICKLVDRKKFGLICFPRLIYCDQEPLLLLNLTVHLFGCTYKAISTRYKICFTPKSLNFSMEASLLAMAKSIYQRVVCCLDNARQQKLPGELQNTRQLRSGAVVVE